MIVYKKARDNGLECALCGKQIDSKYGNNPEPLKVSGVVCDDCNLDYVVPARLKELGLTIKAQDGDMNKIFSFNFDHLSELTGSKIDKIGKGTKDSEIRLYSGDEFIGTYDLKKHELDLAHVAHDSEPVRVIIKKKRF